MPDEDVSGMPPGGAESPGESMWAAAERGAAALEAASGGAPASPVAEAREAERAELETKTPQAKPEPKAAGGEKNIRELEALAAKHGFKVNGNRIEPAERVAFREEKAKARAAIQRDRDQFQALMREEGAKHQGSAAKFQAFEKALEARDVDGLAKAAGFKDFRALLDDHTKQLASPEYRRIQELEKRDREREERDQSERQRREQEQQTANQAQQIQAYKVSLAETMKDNGGQLEKMAADPELVDLMYQVANAHYRATGEEPDIAELIETPSRMLGNKTPLDLLRSKWEALNAIFSDRPAKDEASSEAARRSGSSPRSKEPRVPKTVSQRNAAEASGPTEFKSDKEFMSHFTNLLNQSTHTSG